MRSLAVRRAEWEQFAKENPHHYICTEISSTDRDAFWRSGEEMFQQEMLPVITKYEIKRTIALEMGCGVGRLALAGAAHFEKVVGLDIARTMVSRANANALERRIHNATFITIEDPEQVADQLGAHIRHVDFIYSYLVFQHIDNFDVIDAYLDAIGNLLSPNGIAFLQFDTRAKGAFYYAKSVLPDSFLPRNWRRGIRRIRREPTEIEACFLRHSLEVLESITPYTELHRYIVRPRN